MWNYIKTFWKSLSCGLMLGLALAVLILRDSIIVQFTVSLAIFILILNVVIEKAKNAGAVKDLMGKVFRFCIGILIFVFIRSFAGFFLDMPTIGEVHEGVASSPHGYLGIPFGSIPANLFLELLFLVPGGAIAYLVVKEGRWWRTGLVLLCAMAVPWVAWSMKQKASTQAMKRLSQATINLTTRKMNNAAAAATTCFGVAIANINTFYFWDGTNMTWMAITNEVPQGQRVLQLHPNENPLEFEGQAFNEVVLPGTNGSFVGGIKVWVEAWKFNWGDGRNAIEESKPTASAVIKSPLRGLTLEINLTNDQTYAVSDLSQGQGWRYLSFNGAFSHRVDKGDDKACWKVVENNLPWSADCAGKLQIKAGNSPVKLTVNVFDLR
jgi:hypothetical protein